MTIGISKDLTVIGLEEEVTEGTYIAPQAATSYVQPLDGGYSVNGSKETKSRSILSGTFGQARARVGIKNAEFQLNLEAKASGVEGEKPESDLLFKNLLGTSRQVTGTQTSGTTHTTTVINFADTSAFAVGDIVVVKEAGAHVCSPIKAIVVNVSIELVVAAGSAYSDNVVVSKCTTYLGSNDQNDYKSLSVSMYQGNEILDAAIGVRPSSFSLSGFSTGELASFEFSGDGLSFNREDGAAPHSPTYSDATPPLILSACVYENNGTAIDINDMSISISHSNSFILSTCSEDGRIGSRKTGKREVTGTINPYLDDTSVARWTSFDQNTPFDLFAYAANPSSVAGEFELGSVFGVYLPNCIITSNTIADLEGILVEELEFTSDGSESGEENEIYISFI